MIESDTRELQFLQKLFESVSSKSSYNKHAETFKLIQNKSFKDNISSVRDIDIEYCSSLEKNIIGIQRSNLRNSAILYNIFKHWKMYVVHKLYTRKVTLKAVHFYRTKLEAKVFNALSRNVLLKWQNIVVSMNNSTMADFVIFENYSKAELFYCKILLRSSFKHWLKYARIKHNNRMLTEKAMVFCKVYYLRKNVKYWKEYIIKNREKKIIRNKINEARIFYEHFILRKYLRTWFCILELSSVTAQIENAIEHYCKKLLNKYFHAWIKYYNTRLKKNRLREYIRRYAEKKLLKRQFRQLITYTNEIINERAALERAVIFHDFKIVEKIFIAWQQWYYKKFQNAVKVNKIKRKFESRRQSMVFANWKIYVLRNKCRRRQMFSAASLYKKKLIVRSLRKLRNYVIYRKQKKSELSCLNIRTSLIICAVQELYIEKWTKELYIKMQDKRKLNQSIEFWIVNVLRKYFYHWKDFSRQYKVKARRKMDLNEFASCFLLKRFLSIWYGRYQEISAFREKETSIISTVNRKIMKKYLFCWKDYITLKAKKRDEIDAAKELHKNLLLREGLKDILRNSLRRIDQRYEVQLKAATIKSLTNFESLKEFFDKWRSLIHFKNRSKHLYNEVGNIYFNSIPVDTRLVLPEYMKMNELSDLPVSFSDSSRLHFFSR